MTGVATPGEERPEAGQPFPAGADRGKEEARSGVSPRRAGGGTGRDGLFRIAVLPGDGVGPEVIAEGTKVLDAVARRYGHRFQYTWDVVGGAAIDQYGVALRPETVALCRRSDAVLFGSVGGPKWDDPRSPVRPEQAVLGLRKALGLFANLRPVRTFPQLVSSTTFKDEVVRGVDILFLRELTGGLYFARPKKVWQTARGRRGVDTLTYTETEIGRVVDLGFRLAQSRRRKVTSVDKANVLATSRLWRQIAMEKAAAYPDVTLEHALVDSFAMNVVRRPRDFDVVVTENMFGDILTDLASALAGSLGMLPSASLGTGTLGLYEPIHGSAPDIAGKGIANPLATILSAALLLRHSLGLEEEARAVEQAVEKVLDQGLRTPDIATPGAKTVSTSEMGDAVAELICR